MSVTMAPMIPDTAGAIDSRPGPAPGLDSVASRLAALLTGDSPSISEGEGSELVFEDSILPRALPSVAGVPEVWAVDGGQALVADARCLQVVVTRSAVVCFREGRCVVEEVGELSAHLLGGGQGSFGLSRIGLELGERVPVDINLLRDWAEWSAVRTCVERGVPGALVLVDGDLVPDWRSPAGMVSELMATAAARGITLVGVTKHSSLARGGAPLVGQLEVEALRMLGRSRWWARIGRTRSGSHWPDLQVVVAGLDPDARYAFRIDLPVDADPEPALGWLAAVSNDAAFPGYPYPLSVADRLAACPGWVRAEAWLVLDEALDRAGVPAETRQRAFDDRHRLMERA